MDELAYSSRMINWSPLGKLIFVLTVLITGLLVDSIFVLLISFSLGIAMMAYSTNLRVPLILGLAILEAIVIMIIGSGMISIMGNPAEPAIMEGSILWFKIHMTVTSFNKAWLIFFRAIAGVTVMLAFACSTPIPHLAQAFKSLHCPREITELIVLIYRYAFLLLEKFLVMVDAAQCRLGYNGSMTAIKSYAGAMTGTFIFSMELAEKSEAALYCRNYKGYFPLFHPPQKMSIAWVTVTVIAALGIYFVGMYTADWINMAELFGRWLGW